MRESARHCIIINGIPYYLLLYFKIAFLILSLSFLRQISRTLRIIIILCCFHPGTCLP